ncbi:uncharacterized protein LOC119836414 [Zerene cesonia]|uniref:uncharacterized protein LOC119836414 n=1 Tax=Zerene cesonia TaxID=33412 RepID=UPI0018E516FB|nr:uncharacterized protein LOC119836414 [Zerene cesonia]
MWNDTTWSFEMLTEFSKHFLSQGGLCSHNWFYNYHSNLSKRNFGLLKLAKCLNKPTNIKIMLNIVKRYLGNMIEVTRTCLQRSRGEESQLRAQLDELPQPMRAVILKLELVNIVDAMESTNVRFLPSFCSSAVTKIVRDIAKFARANIAAKTSAVGGGENYKMAKYVLSEMVVKEAAEEMHVSIQTVHRVWKAVYIRTMKRLLAGQPLLLPEWQVADVAIVYDPSLRVMSQCNMEDISKLLQLLQTAIARFPRPAGTVDVIFAIPDPVGSAPLDTGSGCASGSTGLQGSFGNANPGCEVDGSTDTTDTLPGSSGSEGACPNEGSIGSGEGPIGSHQYRDWLARVWTAVHFAYCTRGNLVSLPLLQRRWHEARWLARAAHTSPGSLDTLSSLSSLSSLAPLAQLVTETFPNAVLTQNLPWLELVKNDLVILSPLNSPDMGLVEDLENYDDTVSMEGIIDHHSSTSIVDTEGEDDDSSHRDNEIGDEILEKFQSIDPSNAKVSIIFESDSDNDTGESKSLEQSVLNESGNANEEYQPIAKKPRIDLQRDASIDLRIIDENDIVKSNVVIDNIISEDASPMMNNLNQSNKHLDDSASDSDDDSLMIDESVNTDRCGSDVTPSNERKQKLYVVPLDSVLKSVCYKKNYDKSHRSKFKEESTEANIKIVKDFLNIIDSKGIGVTDVLLDNLNKILNMKYKSLTGEHSKEDGDKNDDGGREKECRNDGYTSPSREIDDGINFNCDETLDPALTMDTKVLVCRCDDIPAWRKHSRNGSIKLDRCTVKNLLQYNKPVRNDIPKTTEHQNEYSISAKRDNKAAASVQNLEREQNIFLDMFTRPLNQAEIAERQKIIQLKLSQANSSPDRAKSNAILLEMLRKPLFVPKSKSLSKDSAKNVPADSSSVVTEDISQSIEDAVEVSSVDKQTQRVAQVCVDVDRFTELSNSHTLVKEIKKELKLLSQISNKLKNVSDITEKRNTAHDSSKSSIDVTKVQAQIGILSAMSKKLNVTQEHISKIKEEVDVFTRITNIDSSKRQDILVTENMILVESKSQNHPSAKITHTLSEDDVESHKPSNISKVTKADNSSNAASTKSRDISKTDELKSLLQEKQNLAKGSNQGHDKSVVISNIPKDILDSVDTQCEQENISAKMAILKQKYHYRNTLHKSTSTLLQTDNQQRQLPKVSENDTKDNTLRSLLLKKSKMPERSTDVSDKSVANANIQGSIQQCLLTKIFNKSTDTLLENVYKHGVSPRKLNNTEIKPEPGVSSVEPSVQVPELQLEKKLDPKIEVPELLLEERQCPEIEMSLLQLEEKLGPKIEVPELQLEERQCPEIEMPLLQLEEKLGPKIEVPEMKIEDSFTYETTNEFDSTIEIAKSDDFPCAAAAGAPAGGDGLDSVPLSLLQVLKRHGVCDEVPASFWRDARNVALAQRCRPARVAVRRFAPRRAKKVELPSIDKLRKMNKTMLVAQVAPTVTRPFIKPQTTYAGATRDPGTATRCRYRTKKSNSIDTLMYKNCIQELYSDVLPLLAFSAKKFLKKNHNSKKAAYRKRQGATDLCDEIDTPFADDFKEWERQKSKVLRFFELPNFKKNTSEVLNNCEVLKNGAKNNETDVDVAKKSEQTVIVLESDDEIPPETGDDKFACDKTNQGNENKQDNDDRTDESKVLVAVKKEIKSEVNDTAEEEKGKANERNPTLAVDVSGCKSSCFIPPPDASVPAHAYLRAAPDRAAPLFRLDGSKPLWLLDSQYIILTTLRLPCATTTYRTSISGPNFERFTKLSFIYKYEDNDDKTRKDKDNGKDGNGDDDKDEQVIDLTASDDDNGETSGSVSAACSRKVKVRTVCSDWILRAHGLDGVTVYSVIHEMNTFQKLYEAKQRLYIYSLKTNTFTRLRNRRDRSNSSVPSSTSNVNSQNPEEHIDLSSATTLLNPKCPSPDTNLTPAVESFDTITNLTPSNAPVNNIPISLSSTLASNALPFILSDTASSNIPLSTFCPISSNYAHNSTPSITPFDNVPISMPSIGTSNTLPFSLPNTAASNIPFSLSSTISSNIIPIPTASITPFDNIPIPMPNASNTLPFSLPDPTPNIALSLSDAMTSNNISISLPSIVIQPSTSLVPSLPMLPSTMSVSANPVVSNQLIPDPATNTNFRPNSASWLIQPQSSGAVLNFLLTPVNVSNHYSSDEFVQNRNLLQIQQMQGNLPDSLHPAPGLLILGAKDKSIKATANNDMLPQYIPQNLFLGPQMTGNEEPSSSINNVPEVNTNITAKVQNVDENISTSPDKEMLNEKSDASE